jgi:hypothetical protein
MESIIDRIKKLMAVGDPASGATEHERDTAMQLVAALMAKHGIDEAKLVAQGEKISAAQQVKEKFTHESSWKSAWYTRVAMAAAALNYTKLLLRGPGGFVFVGRPANIEASELMFRYLVEQVKMAHKAAKPRGVSKAQATDFHKSFRDAASATIYQRAQKMVNELRTNEMVAQQATGSTALVVRNTIDDLLKEAADWVDAVLKPRNARRRTFRVGSGSTAGRQAGERVKFWNSVGGAGQKRIK